MTGAAHAASWLKVAWSPPGWRRPKTLVEAASEADLSQRLPVKREPTKVPRERHGSNPGYSWPGGCQPTGPHGGPSATLAVARPKLSPDSYSLVPGTERCRVSSPTGRPHATPARLADLPLAVKDGPRDQARCLDCRRALARHRRRPRARF